MTDAPKPMPAATLPPALQQDLFDFLLHTPLPIAAFGALLSCAVGVLKARVGVRATAEACWEYGDAIVEKAGGPGVG